MYERYKKVKYVGWARELVKLYNHADTNKFLEAYILDESFGIANCVRKEEPEKSEEILVLSINGYKDVPDSIVIRGRVETGYICPHKRVWVEMPGFKKLRERKKELLTFGKF